MKHPVSDFLSSILIQGVLIRGVPHSGGPLVCTCIHMYMYLTCVSIQVFHDLAYKARNREDLLAGVDEFLDKVTVLPPGEWDPTIRLEPPPEVHGNCCQCDYNTLPASLTELCTCMYLSGMTVKNFTACTCSFSLGQVPSQAERRQTKPTLEPEDHGESPKSTLVCSKM